MLNPSVDDLLRGVADALAAVADRLPPGPEKDQVTIAVGMIRRIARTLPGLVPALQADTHALARAVVALGAGGSQPTSEMVDALALVRRMPAEPLPTLDELTAANLTLRSAVAALAERDDLTAADDARLRAELAALAAREAALRLSPWER